MTQAEGTTNIGKSVTIKGEVSGTEDLFLDCRFDGSISLLESKLSIGPNAHVKADLKVKDLIVFGSLEGNINASGRVELRQSAIVNGDLIANRLSIEESASFCGKVELVGHPSAGASAK